MSRSTGSMRRWSLAVVAAGALSLAPQRVGASRAEDRPRVHGADQEVALRSAHLDRARRSSARVGHRADAAQVPRPHRRRAGHPRSRGGHSSLSRGGRQGRAEAHEVLEDRQDRRRARHRAARDRRRGDHREARQVQGLPQSAHRSAQDDRSAGAAADPHGEADLLDDQRHALAGVGRPRDADGAGVSAHRRRDAVHSEHPQQRHHVHHAGDRGRRPREVRRQPLLQREVAEGSSNRRHDRRRRTWRRRAAPHVLGQVRPARQQPRRHGPVPRADEGDDEDLPRVDADGRCTTCTRRRRTSIRRPARARTTTRSIRSSSTSGGTSRRTT